MRWRVMVVDDDPHIRFLITSHLGEFTREILEFDGAEPAFEALLTGTFDLLITDLQMPGPRDGYWLIAEARQRFADLPIIVITGSSPEDDEVRAADLVVLKPFHPDELLGEALELLTP